MRISLIYSSFSLSSLFFSSAVAADVVTRKLALLVLDIHSWPELEDPQLLVLSPVWQVLLKVAVQDLVSELLLFPLIHLLSPHLFEPEYTIPSYHLPRYITRAI